MKPVQEGKKSLDEVMPIIQTKGQEAMDKAKVEMDSMKETAGVVVSEGSVEAESTTVSAAN